MNSKEIVCEYLRQILQGLIEKTDELEIETTVDEQGVLFTVNVNEDEWGKIIGREGRTAKAVRDILRIKGSMHEMKAAMKINAPKIDRETE